MPLRPPIHRPVGRRDKRERDRDTDRRRDPVIRALYRSARWLAERRLFLAHHPLCAECQRQGRLTPANTVDHITPHRGDPERFWNRDGWQPLCAPCHTDPRQEAMQSRAQKSYKSVFIRLLCL